MDNISVAEADKTDVDGITVLFYHTIQHININDYPQDEVDDWSSWHTDKDKWIEKINEQYFIIAKIDETIVGFGSLAKDGS